MMEIILKNKIVLAAAALVVAGAIWYGFSGDSVPPTVLGTENSADELNEEDRDIVTKLIELKDVDLSVSILESPVFLGLKDFNTEIMDEPKGRPEPFAPLTPPIETLVETPAAASSKTPAKTPAKSPSKSSAKTSTPETPPAAPAAQQSGSGGSSPLFTPLD